MEKIEIDVKNISYPMPCSLLGTKVGGKVNFLTVAFFSMVNYEPPYIMAALGKNHFSNAGIRETGAFSINIPSGSMADVTDYCGIVSGKDTDKSAVFEVFYGKQGNAPMIVECPYNLECRLVQIVDLPADEIFIGEIIAAYSDDRYLTGGVPDMMKIDPFILSMPQMTYQRLGASVGRAWEIGKSRAGKK
ncbi:MAG TPA: flavin reductase family protein [Acidobacteriota bacterium]|nr:flavin reductase family protein [Acidobacteriota bacterium]